MNEPTILYSRSLPGGGYVAVEADALADGRGLRGWVAVERRTDPVRRLGHVPPVIAEAEGPTAQRLLQALREIAADNVSVAQGLRRLEARKDGA